MDFDELFANVCDALRRERRISYRALRRRFELSDDDLEDLTDELIHAKKWAVDEESRVLVWTGETGEVPELTSQPEQTIQPDTQARPTQVERPPTETRTPDAERRQLTVMFCDLVGSTSLSGALDPEDYREVVRQYQQVCSEVISRFDGYIAQYLGDGLLVYFGFPQAHEDDAQRAVRTGLGIVEAIRSLKTRLEPDKGVKLAVRLGIHTGLVVVGEMGGSGRQEQLALGETPNIAARIQGLAEPDTVVISADTYRLIQGYFDCEPLGEQGLRGVAEPVVVYRVLHDRGAQSRLDVVTDRGLTPLVGRESESTLIFERWEQVKNGNGQVILLSGEAGIGKSRLVQVLKEHVADESHIRWECRSSPYFTNSAFYPIIDMVQRTLQFQTDDRPETKLEKVEHNLRQYRLPLEETVPLFGALLSLSVPEERYPTLNLTPQRQRQKTLESTLAIILELAEHQPVLFILEDLHWTDPTTLEFLGLLVDQTPTASLCVLLTCRPEFQPPWQHRSYLSEMTVNRLSQSQLTRMAEQVAGEKRLPAEIIEQLVDKTDGVPLYVEEMTKSVIESEHLKEVDGHYELTGSLDSLTIPATLQDSLMARLDRLVTAKAVVQYASVIGRQFSYELLQLVSELDEPTLRRELERLVEAELVYQRGVVPDATYVFKHALLQDTAYESLLRRTRQQYHERIGLVLEGLFPEVADTQPELLAHHYTESGQVEKAIDYWHRAGQYAIERSANIEAIALLQRGIALLPSIAETSVRTQQELLLNVTLGTSMLATKGYASSEVGVIFSRARELCQQVGDTPQLFRVLLGLWAYFAVRAELPTALELGEQLIELAQNLDDSALIVEACMRLGATLSAQGQLALAQAYFERGMALYNPVEHHNHAFIYGQAPQVSCLAQVAWVLWAMGYPDQARQRSYDALRLAEDLAHPFTLAYSLFYVTFLHYLLREWNLAQERAEALVALCRKYDFAYRLAQAQIFQELTMIERGQGEAVIDRIHEGLEAVRTTGSEVFRPSFLALLAEAHGKARQPQAGLPVCEEAFMTIDKTSERFYEAGLYVLQGELLMALDSPRYTEAEFSFRHGLEIARQQQAKSLELRAAMSLAKLWRTQGKRQEAYDLLAPVYNWFSEGHDTADLIDAKALLDELSEGQP